MFKKNNFYKNLIKLKKKEAFFSFIISNLKTKSRSVNATKLKLILKYKVSQKSNKFYSLMTISIIIVIKIFESDLIIL